MKLFIRLQEIITANLGELTEGCDNPEAVLRQAIAEMEMAIHEAKQDTARVMANEKFGRKELADNERLAQAWQERAEKAVESGDDALARKALVRKQEHDRLIAALTDQIAKCAESSQLLKRQYEAMRAKLAEAKRSLNTLLARQKAAQLRIRVAGGAFQTDAFAKFDQITGRIEMSEAQADALAQLHLGSSVELDVESATRDDLSIDADLAELKRKLNE